MSFCNPVDECEADILKKQRKGLFRLRTSYSFNEETHCFSVVEPVNVKPLWESTINKHYPGAMREEAFVKKSHTILDEYGFHRYNTLTCITICRDEMCSPFMELVDEHWKSPFMNIKDEEGKKETLYTHSFVMSSLAGMLFLGTTGMMAAVSHAPVDTKDGRQRYVFFAFPHIGLCDKGTFGKVERPGHEQPTAACGALAEFNHELTKGDLHLELDTQDIEYSLLKQRLLKKIKLFSGHIPSIEELTNVAYETIVEDLEKLVDRTIDKKASDYVILAGVQIHTPGGASYIWPGTSYVVKEGVRSKLEIPHD